MSETIQETLFLQERGRKIEDTIAHLVGPKICVFLTRITKVAEVYAADHNQTVVAAREFAAWLEEQFVTLQEESLQVQMTASNFFLNGQLIRLDARTYASTLSVRTMFMGYAINQVTFNRGVGAEEVIGLVQALKAMKQGNLLALEDFRQPNIELASVDERELDVDATEDPRREIIELYAGLIIKCNVYFHRLRRGGNPSTKHIKRLVQRICDQIRENGDIFIGLINLRMILGQDFVHAVNTSIYAMMLADSVELNRLDLVRCGMTAISQDIERLHAAAEQAEAGFQTGDETHFQTNLSSVITVSSLGATDVLSALRLVTSYERGFPYNKPLPQAWYREELRPHLLSRIVEIARHYDILTQGLEGESKSPDRALQSMMMKMGSYYDPNLMKLFVNVVGIYPVGSIVELSTGERAMVLRSPSVLTENRISNAHRPTVKLLDSERIVDLSLPAHGGTRILRIIENDSVDERPGAFFLF